MGIPISVVDAFTDRPFSGNPAAVCQLEAWPAEAWMQAVAAEMNVAETAFVVARDDGDYELRWFTPTVEVPLCGHATLASAWLLGGSTRFHTASGLLVCQRRDDGTVEIDLPADPVRAVAEPPGLRAALGTNEVYVVMRGRSGHLLVEVGSASLVRRLAPEPAALAAIDTPGVIVTAAGDRDGLDCVSRFFAPRIGIPEDPVTGAAHCALAGYWGDRLGRDELLGEQASPRGGLVGMRRAADRVVLSGKAVLVWRGELLARP